MKSNCRVKFFIYKSIFVWLKLLKLNTKYNTSLFNNQYKNAVSKLSYIKLFWQCTSSSCPGFIAFNKSSSNRFILTCPRAKRPRGDGSHCQTVKNQKWISEIIEGGSRGIDAKVQTLHSIIG